MLRAGAALPLTGRYGSLAMEAARGLSAWAVASAVRLTIEDCGEEPARAARTAVDLAGRVDVLFGPYGSGATQAVVDALAGRQVVLWNHGGAAIDREEGSWVIDVLAPAGRYWAGLAEALAGAGVDLARVAVLHSQTGFGQAVGAGAIAALRRAGHEPIAVAAFDARTAVAAATRVRDVGATTIVGSGRFEDDVALAESLRDADVTVGLVACGVAAARQAMGDAVLGWFGPCQWLEDRDRPPALEPEREYPAAQAYACGLVAQQAIAAAGTAQAAAVWDAARALRTSTFFGGFAVDSLGRQVAHTPVIVRWVSSPDGPRRAIVWQPESA